MVCIIFGGKYCLGGEFVIAEQGYTGIRTQVI